MSNNQNKNTGRRYWLKLKNTYFNQLAQKKMRKQERGVEMQIVYLKMMLLSINENGKIYYQGVYDTLEEELAEEFSEELELIQMSLEYFRNNKLIETDEDQHCFIPEVTECIGSESSSAERMRKKREKDKMSHCDMHVTSSDTDIRYKRIDNREKKKEIYNVEQSATAYPFKEIIEYLNQRTERNYKYTTKTTQKHIKARFIEGFSLEDFKKVIDGQVQEWKGTNMEKYLRPETLFGVKFEGYLNAIPAIAVSNHSTPEEVEESIDYGEIVREW